MAPALVVEEGHDALENRVQRFTRDGSDNLEQHLHNACARVLAGVGELVEPKDLEGILLGGGYGRGEGGVLRTGTGDQPYNDMEFYVCLRGNPRANERRYGEALHRLGHELSHIAGVDVEFKVLSLAVLRRSPVTMFSYDLVAGHRWVLGEEGMLADCKSHEEAGQIPLYEAARLLMNRGAGLLFSRFYVDSGVFTAANADFIHRNMAKAELALGDALLTAYGMYHWSCLERSARLKRFTSNLDVPWLDDVKRRHATGVQFKLHPRRGPESLDGLGARHAELSKLALQVFLWIEQRRLNQSFVSARDYALNFADKCPETRPWRNCLVNAVAFGPEILLTKQALRYPRERLFNSLALLLWEPALLIDSKLLRRVQGELRTSVRMLPALVEAFRSLWVRFR